MRELASAVAVAKRGEHLEDKVFRTTSHRAARRQILRSNMPKGELEEA